MEQVQDQQICRFGDSCKFFKKNKCKNFHPPKQDNDGSSSDFELDVKRESYQPGGNEDSDDDNNQIHYNRKQQHHGSSYNNRKPKNQSNHYNRQQNTGGISHYQKKGGYQQKKDQNQKYQVKSCNQNQKQEKEKEEEEEEEKKVEQDNMYKRKQGQSLKDYYDQIQKRNQQVYERAHWIEAQDAGYSDLTECELEKKSYNDKIEKVQNSQDLNKKVVIGIDFGNVICGSDPFSNPEAQNNEDTMFSDNYLKTPKIPGAEKGVKFLVDKFGAENIYIVSKAGEKVSQKSKEWLIHHQFYQKTGLIQDKNVVFCKERKDKATICTNLGINYFIDDTQAVLQHIKDKVTKFLFPSQKNKNVRSCQFISVNGWDHLIDIFEKVQKV